MDGKAKPIELEPRDNPRRFNKLAAGMIRIKKHLAPSAMVSRRTGQSASKEKRQVPGQMKG